MKSDFVFVLIALGTLVCVTCTFPTSSEIQQDSNDDHTSIQEDLLAFLNQVADSQQDYSDEKTDSAEAEIFRKVARKVKDFAGRLGGRGSTYPGGDVPAPEFIYIPGGSPVKPDSGQGYSRGGAPAGGGPQRRTRGREPTNLGEGIPAPEFTYIPGTSQENPDSGQGYSSYGRAPKLRGEYGTKTSKSQLYDDNTMQVESQVAVIGTLVGGAVSLLAPYAVDVVHKVGQFTGRAIKGVGNFIFNRRRGSTGGGEYPHAYPRYPEDPPRYPDGGPGYPEEYPQQYNDLSSKEEEPLESELLQTANQQPKVVPFRRESFIKNPDQWKLKPNYKRGFFDSIWDFFKNLYQTANL